MTDPIPDADLWLCRDVLFHLPLADCQLVLGNLAASKVKYFLIKTYDFVGRNADVRPGGFRYINLRAPPFKRPAPAKRVADFHVPGPPGYLDLWTREQIHSAVTDQRGISGTRQIAPRRPLVATGRGSGS